MSSTQQVPGPNIDSILIETRSFPPPPEFSKNAHIKSKEEYDKNLRPRCCRSGSLLGRDCARAALVQALGQGPGVEPRRGRSGSSAASSTCPTTASTGTCETWRKNKAAIIWEGEPGEVRTCTYQQLLAEVQKFANVLKSLGIKSGDRVAIYMGMCPELPIAMLACARIGALHSVIFGGFSANALVDRITDQEAVAVITQDGSYRRGGEVKLKAGR